MKRAISEINRRREKQIAFNLEHGITPKTIIKAIKEEEVTKLKDVLHIPAADVPLMIEELTEQMNIAAESLDFEKAIEIRDQVHKLRERLPKD
jgi:excinuclease ABC subunit B